MGALFNTLLVNPIINLLVGIYQLLVFLHVPFALGFSIILLTALIRLILYPFTLSQLQASKKMQEVTPHLNKIKERHKHDAKRLQEETMKLYREYGINPAAGCLPVLIQLPVIWALYSVFTHIIKLKPNETITVLNKTVYFPFLKLQHVWDTLFFGIQLGETPSHLIKTLGPAILLIPVITAALQFAQSKMMIPAKKEEKKPAKNDKKNESMQNDFAQAFQMQTLYFFPLMLGYLSFSFPVGLSLYWNTFTIFGIIQQYQVQRSKEKEEQVLDTKKLAPKKLITGKKK